MILGAWLLPSLESPSDLNPIDCSGWTDAPAELAKHFPVSNGDGGIFTTMRVKNEGGQARGVALGLHVDRFSANEFGISCEVIRDAITKFVDDKVSGQYPEHQWLALVVILAKSPSTNNPSLGFCLKSIPPPPLSCSVLAIPAPSRSSPSIKSTTWIHQRASLDALKQGTDYNEVLLVDPTSNRILEGLSSNFGVVNGVGAVESAPDGMVLSGTVMSMARQACKEIGIEVADTCPDIGEANDWQAAFITSTSRLILPIHRIYFNG